jgi:hypothetical protein
MAERLSIAYNQRVVAVVMTREGKFAVVWDDSANLDDVKELQQHCDYGNELSDILIQANKLLIVTAPEQDNDRTGGWINVIASVRALILENKQLQELLIKK